MNSQADLDGGLQQFCGQAPLFPLPDAVFFPHALLPLHVFEPRYRKMVGDALDAERVIAMALLKPGWESVYEEKTAPIFDTVCLGRISAHERLDDGRYNLILQGLSRATVIDEKQDDRPYRVARLDVSSDHYPAQPVIDRCHRQRELLLGFRELFPKIDLDHVLHQSLDAEIPLGQMCDVLAQALKLEPSIAQNLLEEVNVDLRSDMVLSHLRVLARKMKRGSLAETFPPQFSAN